MLDVSVTNLMAECRAAELFRDDHLQEFTKRIQRYHGPAYVKGSKLYDPENRSFEWVARVVPQIVFNNPRANVGSVRPEVQGKDAVAVEFGLNRWIKDTDYRKTLKRHAVDVGFLWSVGVVKQQSQPGTTELEDPPMRPVTEYLSQNLYAFDPLANSREEARYEEHRVVTDKDDLLRMAQADPEGGWDLKVIEALNPDAELDERKGRKFGVPPRNQVEYREIWVKDYDSREQAGISEADWDKYHGTIFCIAEGADAQSGASPAMLRKPRPYYGPRWGPYTIFGAHIVPGDPYPLGALVAIEKQIELLNASRKALDLSGTKRKKLMLYDNTDPNIAQALLDCPDGGSVGVSGFDKNKFAEVELGTLTEVQLAYHQHLSQLIDRLMGIDDSAIGRTDSAATATAVAEASANRSIRISDLQSEFYAATQRQLCTVAWYLWNDDRVSYPLGKDAAAQLPMPEDMAVEMGIPPEIAQQPGILAQLGVEVEFQGGDFNGSFDQLELDIEPYSMQRADEGVTQARAMQVTEVGIGLLQAQMALPGSDLSPFAQKIGDAFNWPGFADSIGLEDTRKLGALMLMGQAMQTVQPQGGGGAPQSSGGTGGNFGGGQPRLSQDTAGPRTMNVGQGGGTSFGSHIPQKGKAPGASGAKPVKGAV